jgi:alkylated DNA nucleotide flippase Atl1
MSTNGTGTPGQLGGHLAILARSVARSLEEFAHAIEADAGDPVVVADDELRDPGQDHNLGVRQRQIVDVPGLADEGGVKTATIASSIGYEVPNTYSTLQALVRQGIVEMVPDKEPQHWRLARRYRSNGPAFMRLASHVDSGEWTTYGDISIAVMGSPKGARGVGRAAAMLPDFPNPHRVLMNGGEINDSWRSAEGLGPEECRRRLEAEGVGFGDDGRADRARSVDWHELMRRDAQSNLDQPTQGEAE